MPSSTTWILAFLLIISCVFLEAQAQKTYPSKNQDITIQRVRNLFTSFPTVTQFKAILNNVSANCYAEQTWDKIKEDGVNKAMEILTTQQYGTVLMKGSALMSQLKNETITTAINKCMTVLGNNLSPFFTQMQQYVVYLKGRGLTEQAVVKNGYRITNTFCSKKRIKTIFTRVSLQYTSNDWAAIVKNLQGIIEFAKNGFT